MDKAILVGFNLCPGKNGYISRRIFYSLFLAPKIKYCLTKDDFGIMQEHKTFKGFNVSKRPLHRSQNFKKIEGKKISAIFHKSWKKSFDSWVIIPRKRRFCNECEDKIICNRCNIQIYENEGLEANLNESKRQPRKQFGHMLPHIKE